MKEIEKTILKIIRTSKGKENFILFYIAIHWQDIGGENIAKHSRPVRLENNILTINTDNTGWAHNLLLMKNQLIDKINNLIHQNVLKENARYKIKNLLFLNGSIKAVTVSENIEENEELVYESLLEKENEEIDRQTSLIENNDLKKSLMRILKNDKKRKNALYKASENTCQSCGVPIIKSEKFCSFCLRKHKDEQKEKIVEILSAAPWVEYEECINYVKCDKMLFNEVKTDLKRKIYRNVAEGNSNSTENLAAALFFSGLTPDKIGENDIEEIVKRLRRKKNVPSSWG